MIDRLVAALVPPHDREAVLGDLYEEFPAGGGLGSARRLFALVGIALRYELEPYLRGAHGREAMGLLAAGLGLLYAVGAAGAAWVGAEIPAGYDPVSRATLGLWTSPHLLGLLSALSAGLVAGRAGASLGATPRRHVVLALSVLSALLAPALFHGLAAAGLCLSGAWLGAAARHEAASTRTGASR